MEPMVSICCAAYNHAPYIAQALESFLAQEAPFSIEILVHDDASTDGTQEILREYARRYPDVVKPLFETENQYSKGVAIDPTFNYPRARGKYIALCEGDDLWSDPHKLRRQVDYMEAHPDCTFCFTNGLIRDADGRAPDRPFLPYSEKDAPGYFRRRPHLHAGRFLRPQLRAHGHVPLSAIGAGPAAAVLLGQALPPRRPQAAHVPDRGGLRRLPARLHLRVPRKRAHRGHEPVVARDRAARVRAQPQRGRNARDVDEFSQKRYTEQVGRFRDWYLYVMLWNAPSARVLRDPDARRVYRALPPARRLKYRFKRLLAPLRG